MLTIKFSGKKDSLLLLFFFLSKSPGGHVIYRRNERGEWNAKFYFSYNILFPRQAVLKMFLRFSFGLKQVKSSKNVQQELFTVQKNGETGTKRALDYFRMPKLQQIFTTAAMVFHRYERLAVSQNVFPIILLWAREDIEKNFSKKLYTVEIKKKKEGGTKSSAWDLKNA